MFGGERGAQEIKPPRSDPAEVAERLRRALLLRIDADGRERGLAELDPLLWPESTHLLSSPRFDEAEALFTRSLADGSLASIRDPLRRAILQRDLWAVFDWLAKRARDLEPTETLPDGPRRALRLAILLAQSMKRLALTPAEIVGLPDVYAAAVASKSWPAEPAGESDGTPSEAAFLPTELLTPTGPWIELHGEGEPLTPLHGAFFDERSIFTVHIRLPGGREEGLKYLARLREFPSPLVKDENPEHRNNVPEGVWESPHLNPATPQFPKGTRIALVRRAVLFDADGVLRATSLIESVQMRRFRAIAPSVELGEVFEGERQHQQLLEFVLDRDKLFRGESGGLRAMAPAELAYHQFLGHGEDPLEGPRPERARPHFDRCMECHGAPGIFSAQSYTRINTGEGTHFIVPGVPPRPLHGFEVRPPFDVSAKAGRYEWGLLAGLLASSR